MAHASILYAFRLSSWAARLLSTTLRCDVPQLLDQDLTEVFNLLHGAFDSAGVSKNNWSLGSAGQLHSLQVRLMN